MLMRMGHGGAGSPCVSYRMHGCMELDYKDQRAWNEIRWRPHGSSSTANMQVCNVHATSILKPSHLRRLLAPATTAARPRCATAASALRTRAWDRKGLIQISYES